YYDAYYRKAQLARTKIINEFNDAFNKFDFLISPTAPTTAFKFGEKTDNPLDMYLSDSMTVGASLAGVPALILPTVRKPDKDHMPVGVQIMANQRQDKKLIQLGEQIEKEILK
ncbi:Asp-tRNA(Asn)/Glu-tRNA(Gln) amidotransferase GatCAB subunit A, partial [Candidatus Saccharibacteria bacterium]|nr:Asp-tRNA(Asn)/Glu-tRNA(Gln) amidotransferase GatCAB subunit A [Candidatus Saccharibacteria bacterium]